MGTRRRVPPAAATGAVEAPAGRQQRRLGCSDVRFAHIARQLTEAGIERAQADVLADAIRQAADRGEYVTPEMLRAELAALESRIYRAMLVQAGAIVGALVGIGGIVVGVLRLFGRHRRTLRFARMLPVVCGQTTRSSRLWFVPA